MRKLVVYGGRLEILGKTQRCFIATRTKKRAIEILRISKNEFKNYWCETHNAEELKTALENSEIIFLGEKF